MQSGVARSKHWVLEFPPSEARRVDPLMGWTSSGDTKAQVRISFDSMDAAISYAEVHGIEFVLSRPQVRKPIVRKQGYGENFAYRRRDAWTH